MNVLSYEQLLAENEKLRAELEKAKSVPMKYRRMEFNAQLQNENTRLRAELDALKAWKEEVEKQEPVLLWHLTGDPDEEEVFEVNEHNLQCPYCKPLYARPVPAQSASLECWMRDVSDLIKQYGNERAIEAYHGELHCRQKPSEVLAQIVEMLAASLKPEVK